MRIRRSAVPESDTRLAQVVRRHFDVDLVPHADADEVLAHLAGDMGEHFVAVGQSHTEHGAGEHLSDRTRQFDWLFFRHAKI